MIAKWFFNGSRIRDQEIAQLSLRFMVSNEQLNITQEVKDAIEENIRDKANEYLQNGSESLEAARAAVFAAYPAHERIANGRVVEPAHANISLFKDGY